MASCGNTQDDDIDGDLNGSESDNDVPTPTSENKSKRKDKDSEEGGSSKKKSRSWVWEHITRLEKNRNKGRCHYCKKILSCPTKDGTTTLSRHLRLACKAYKAWKSANVDEDQSVITSDARLSKVSEAVFREAVNEMLVLAELPLAFIESLAFRHFCSKVKLYRPHSRRTATRDIVELYVRKKEAMKKILGSNKQRVSLTTDIWVCPHTAASYMVITAHFVDDWWNLRKMIIGFKHVGDHKSEIICDVLLECLTEWDIKRVFCITVDNATANTLGLSKFKQVMKQNGDDALILDGKYLHLRCATHILNLIVRDGLLEEVVDKSVAAIRNGIVYVRSSTNRLKSFNFRAETGKIKRGSLPLDVKTRWNSTYLMLEQALKFRLAFEKMEAEDKPFNDFFQEKVDGKKRIGPPIKDDWDGIDRFVQILATFYRSTLVLSASTSVACHKLYNEIVTITRNLNVLAGGPDEELQKKAKAMLLKLDKYWNPFGDNLSDPKKDPKKAVMNKLVIVASVFDPRKKMKFSELCFEMLYGKDSVECTHLSTTVTEILKDLFDEYSRSSLLKNSTSGSAASSQSVGGASQSQDEAAVGSGFRERQILESAETIFDEIMKETRVHNPSNELDLYLNENLETPFVLKGTEYDLLSWWKLNSGKFPILSLIAKDILAMQVSSVASESAFSTSGRILEPSRSCLSHYMIEVLMCLEQWLKCEININEKGVSTIQELLADVELEDELRREFEPGFDFQGFGPSGF